jgi:hypothetical protein
MVGMNIPNVDDFNQGNQKRVTLACPENIFHHEGNQIPIYGVIEDSWKDWFEHSKGKSEFSARPLLDSAPHKAPFFLGRERPELWHSRAN